MVRRISKSKFKARALQFFREVEKTGRELVITDHGRPAVKIVPYREPEAGLAELRDTVVRYDDPLEPVALEDWESLR